MYALVTETIKHSSLIDKLFENCKVLVDQPRLDPWLAKVLTVELLFGKKALPGKSKPEITISSYREQFEKYKADHKEDIKTEGNILFSSFSDLLTFYKQLWPTQHLERGHWCPLPAGMLQ